MSTIVFWLIIFISFMTWIRTRGPAKLIRWVARLPLRLFIARRRP